MAQQLLSLSLLVFSVFTDNPDNTISFYNLTFSTYFFYRGANFHN